MNATSRVCKGVVINFTCTAEANPAVHTYLLYDNDTVIENMGISGTLIKTLDDAGQFVFRCEANNSVLEEIFPASVEQVENEVVKEGGDVEVYCNVTAGTPVPTDMWTKVATREHIEGNPLNITNITRAQAGEYKCTANNTCGVDFTVVYIDVQYKPDEVHLNKNTTNKVCAGITINFTCSAEANPAVHTYLLYKNDTVIYNTTLGTVIETVENAGQFVFRCEANNSVDEGTGRSSDTLLTVHEPATIVTQERNKTPDEGDNVVVYCNVTGIPDPTVVWKNVKTGEIIEGNLLNITNITKAQAGEYNCTANNTCGVDSTMVNIDVRCKKITVTLLYFCTGLISWSYYY
ncbi:peroxidasin-like [Orbicella faveolata]|uniref:peroxidasin-like n=1 Tax=Orbicella faveolata TaxID=48498 RepID=UPI0009E1C1AA|nr:peroxidasin-like [Orbicella faveolata]